MCQLLGMNSNKPASLGFSFAGFAERGGNTGDHSDGWGIAVHEAAGCRVIVDHMASVESPLAQGLNHSELRARNVVAHIRKATQGQIAVANSHPFARELWGRTWTFAHNGNLKDFVPAPNPHYQPVGETDSERAFCMLMGALRASFPDGEPSRTALFDAIAASTGQIAGHGTFNFILSNGEFMLAHCSTRLHYVLRQYPFAEARLLDRDTSIHFSQHNHLDDRMAVIATEPLTAGEEWRAFAPGELKMFVNGGAHNVLPDTARKPRQLRISY